MLSFVTVDWRIEVSVYGRLLLIGEPVKREHHESSAGIMQFRITAIPALAIAESITDIPITPRLTHHDNTQREQFVAPVLEIMK